MSPEREPTRRLFIGLFPDAEVQAAIEAHRRTWSWPRGARFTHPSRIHMTLHFLGEVPVSRQAVLASGLAEVRVPRLTLTIRTPQAWRNRVAVLRCDENDALRALHDALAAPIERAGLPVDRGHWTPHLTIARKTLGAVPPLAFEPITWTVDEALLVESHMTPPVRYEVLSRYRAL